MSEKNKKFNFDLDDWVKSHTEEPISSSIFYTIEKTIKQYRRFAQKNFDEEVGDITLDQAMILSFINRCPDLNQSQIASMMFKDNASVTRMIDLTIKKGYLNRKINNNDRRKFVLSLTPKARKTLSRLKEIRSNNRLIALQSISPEQYKILKETLETITSNCKLDD